MVCIAEYVWMDVNNNYRSKARTLTNELNDVADLPEWNYDGSSTGQAVGHDSEIVLKPAAFCRCPFRGLTNDKPNLIVLCDTYKVDGTPLENNHRKWAKEIFDKDLEAHPWYGLEQEYFIINPDTGKPLGFPKEGEPEPQFQYYCSVGEGNAFGRKLVDEHYRSCLYAGIQMSGINAEVAPGQWEFQIGPAEGISAADQLHLARYILIKLAEKYEVKIDFHPKPVKGDWNGSGCHTNYSTKVMREGTDDKTGLQHIDEALEKLSLKHDEHMAVYGTDNEQRMTGAHETSSYDKFTFGRANRGASVRIPTNTINEKKGYFEDRRPSSNCDPYLVTAKIFETCSL